MIVRCERCANFMNWEKAWGDLFRCLDCGHHQIIQAPERQDREEG